MRVPGRTSQYEKARRGQPPPPQGNPADPSADPRIEGDVRPGAFPAAASPSALVGRGGGGVASRPTSALPATPLTGSRSGPTSARPLPFAHSTAAGQSSITITELYKDGHAVWPETLRGGPAVAAGRGGGGGGGGGSVATPYNSQLTPALHARLPGTYLHHQVPSVMLGGGGGTSPVVSPGLARLTQSPSGAPAGGALAPSIFRPAGPPLSGMGVVGVGGIGGVGRSGALSHPSSSGVPVWRAGASTSLPLSPPPSQALPARGMVGVGRGGGGGGAADPYSPPWTPAFPGGGAASTSGPYAPPPGFSGERGMSHVASSAASPPGASAGSAPASITDAHASPDVCSRLDASYSRPVNLTSATGLTGPDVRLASSACLLVAEWTGTGPTHRPPEASTLANLSANGYREIAIVQDAGHQTAALVAVNPDGREAMVAFRGTKYPENAATDVDIRLLTHMGTHSGFTSVTQALEPGVLEYLRQQKINITDCRMTITGHSMGGAMAVVFARYLCGTHVLNPAQMSVLTLGAPRVFNAEAAVAYDTVLGTRTLQLRRHGDSVPQIPSMGLGYRHCGIRAELADIRLMGDSADGDHSIIGYVHAVNTLPDSLIVQVREVQPVAQLADQARTALVSAAQSINAGIASAAREVASFVTGVPTGVPIAAAPLQLPPSIAVGGGDADDRRSSTATLAGQVPSTSGGYRWFPVSHFPRMETHPPSLVSVSLPSTPVEMIAYVGGRSGPTSLNSEELEGGERSDAQREDTAVDRAAAPSHPGGPGGHGASAGIAEGGSIVPDAESQLLGYSLDMRRYSQSASAAAESEGSGSSDVRRADAAVDRAAAPSQPVSHGVPGGMAVEGSIATDAERQFLGQSTNMRRYSQSPQVPGAPPGSHVQATRSTQQHGGSTSLWRSNSIVTRGRPEPFTPSATPRPVGGPAQGRGGGIGSGSGST